MLGEAGDSQEWLKATQQFPNGVPRFESKEECLDWAASYCAKNGGSNPLDPHLMHIFTMLTHWKHVKLILTPAIQDARREPPNKENPLEAEETNVYQGQPAERVVHQRGVVPGEGSEEDARSRGETPSRSPDHR